MERNDLEQMNELVKWLAPLSNLNDTLWTTPIAEGKWAIQGIISHIMLWDKYFLENAIKPICHHDVITVEELDFEEFNRNAVDYGRHYSKEELVKQAIQYRSLIISNIASLSDEDYFKDYPNFSIPQYITDFVWHDNHHRSQIDDFLSHRP